jgi:hypothetical protein
MQQLINAGNYGIDRFQQGRCSVWEFGVTKVVQGFYLLDEATFSVFG